MVDRPGQTSTSTGSAPSTRSPRTRLPGRSGAVSEHGLRDPPWRAAHEPGPVSPFGYLSVPTGPGPFPAIYYAPKYQRARDHPPGHGEHAAQPLRHLRAASRGQRTADTPYAAMFPGLLTDGIDQPESYVFRGIVAERARGPGVLLAAGRGTARVVVVGNDVALITAALQPGATHVVSAPALFHDTVALAPAPSTRWRRSTTTCGPSRSATRCRMLAFYDLLAFAPRVSTPSKVRARRGAGRGGPPAGGGAARPGDRARLGAAQIRTASTRVLDGQHGIAGMLRASSLAVMGARA